MNVSAEKNIQGNSSFNETEKKIPRALKDTIFDLTMNILFDRPSDPFTYAAQHFRKMKESRKTKIVYDLQIASPQRSLVSDEVRIRSISLFTKRSNVCGESYDPVSVSLGFIKPVFEKTSEELMKLHKGCEKIFLFRCLEEEQLDDVLAAMIKMDVAKNQVIIRQGDPEDYFYVIDHGIFNVYIKYDEPDSEPKLVHTYIDSGFFGELALLYNKPRAATVQAMTDGTLWALDSITFRHLVLISAYQKRKRYEDLIEHVRLFDNLTPYEKMNLTDALVSKEFQDGDMIHKSGDEPIGMFIVESGEVSIRITNDAGEEIEVERVQIGQAFGHRSLLSGRRLVENIYALGDVKLAFLDKLAFDSCLGTCMEDIQKDAELYLERLEDEINLHRHRDKSKPKICFRSLSDCL